jgi:hypothetical protein
VAKVTDNADITVLIDKVIGEPPHNLRVYANLKFLLDDQNDYFIKLLEARRIPKDPSSIRPDDPLIKMVSEIEFIAAMPDKTPAEREAKNRLILEELAAHYEKHAKVAENEAVLLALTIENTFTEPPTPYSETETSGRQRPGLVQLPEPVRDLRHPVEARLKQVIDRLYHSPEAFNELQEVTRYLAIEMGRRMQNADRDGFRRK